jgi:alpha-L-arabinofuranosidase
MRRCLTILCGVSVATYLPIGLAQVTVHVDASGDIGTVPPRIFGTFLEPIDHSIDNGVVAEILVNSSLEARLWNHAMMEEIYRDQPDLVDSSDGTGIPFPWQPLNPAAGNRYELHAGDVANSWQSLEIIGVRTRSLELLNASICRCPARSTTTPPFTQCM